MNPIKLSAVIITFNEEKNIARCLESVQHIADEIIVIDSFSTDRTEEICRKFKVKFLTNKFEGHVQQKNYAMEIASYDHVLSVDADEALTDTLMASIADVKKNFGMDAYAFNRLTNYCGSWIRHCGWYPDRKIRLWNRKKGRWGGENPHDKVLLDQHSSSGFLKGDLLHYSYHTISDHLKQLDKFTTIAAHEAFKRNKKITPFIHVIIYPFLTFIRMYFFKRGFLDGYPGFLVCVSGAYYRFIKYAKLNALYSRK